MKKIKKILYLIILSTFLLPLTVLANDKITLKVDKSDLSAGDVVTVDAVMPEDLKMSLKKLVMKTLLVKKM